MGTQNSPFVPPCNGGGGGGARSANVCCSPPPFPPSLARRRPADRPTDQPTAAGWQRQLKSQRRCRRHHSRSASCRHATKWGAIRRPPSLSQPASLPRTVDGGEREEREGGRGRGTQSTGVVGAAMQMAERATTPPSPSLAHRRRRRRPRVLWARSLARFLARLSGVDDGATLRTKERRKEGGNGRGSHGRKKRGGAVVMFNLSTIYDLRYE